MTPLELAGRRQVPPLAFVITPEGIAQFATSAAELRSALAPHRLQVITTTDDAAAAAGALWAGMRGTGYTPEGIVLLGGYDTLPPQIIRTFWDALAPSVSFDDEDDNYLVWNDDHYGDRNRDGLPELPVSRIPAGVDLWRALRAAPADGADPRDQWRAFRIKVFSYAEAVYADLPDATASPMLNYSSTNHTAIKKRGLTADRVFVATHAVYRDADAYKSSTGVPIVTTHDIPDAADGAVVLAACCHSVMLIKERAIDVEVGLAGMTPIGTNESMAKTWVDKGAQAYIGFTGKLWTPTVAPYDYLAGKLTRLFWQKHLKHDMPPSKALFGAKAEFILNMPCAHPLVKAEGLSEPTSIAQHLKDYWGATCIGLGW
jgi:hypothetical protein